MEIGCPSIGGLGLDPAHAPAQHGGAVLTIVVWLSVPHQACRG